MLKLNVVSAGGHGSKSNVLLSGVAREGQERSNIQKHEECGSRLLLQIFQACDGRDWDVEDMSPSSACADAGAGMIGRELQGIEVDEPFLPEFDPFVKFRRPHELLLPSGVVDVTQ